MDTPGKHAIQKRFTRSLKKRIPFPQQTGTLRFLYNPHAFLSLPNTRTGHLVSLPCKRYKKANA